VFFAKMPGPRKGRPAICDIITITADPERRISAMTSIIAPDTPLEGAVKAPEALPERAPEKALTKPPEKAAHNVRLARAADELAFRGSPTATVGVEIELQILDRETGDLASGAVPLLQACASENLPGISAELMQSMIELKTGVCRNAIEARDEILPVLRRLHNIASSLGYDLAMGGTHPFHRSGNSAVYPAERYERIMDRLAWLTYQRVLFGLHIHVGVPSGDRAIAVTNLLVQYLPHLLAVSASSPFWQGVDTGLVSSRA